VQRSRCDYRKQIVIDATMHKVIREDGSSVWVLTGPTVAHAWTWAEKNEPNAAYVYDDQDKRLVSYAEYKGML